MIIEYSLQAFWQGHNCPYQCAVFIPKFQERSGNDERNCCENNQLGEVFPALLILLDIGAAIVYAKHRDWRKVIYWLAAAILNAAVTF